MKCPHLTYSRPHFRRATWSYDSNRRAREVSSTKTQQGLVELYDRHTGQHILSNMLHLHLKGSKAFSTMLPMPSQILL